MYKFRQIQYSKISIVKIKTAMNLTFLTIYKKLLRFQTGLNYCEKTLKVKMNPSITS